MKTFFYIRILILLFLFVGCQQNQDVIPVTPKTTEVISPEMAALQIPAGFDWSTTTTLNLTVTSDNLYSNKNYLIEVFDNNPFFAPSAALLAQGAVKSNETFSAALTLPKGAKVLYIRQTDPKGKQVVQEYATDVSTITADFSSTATKSLKSGSLKTTPANVVSEYEIPSDAIEISNSGGVNSFTMDYDNGKKKHYVIKGTYTGSLSYNGWGEGVELYVKGQWVNTGSSINMGKGDKLIILPEAKMTTKSNLDINMTNSALIFVGKEASLDAGSLKINIKASNGTEQLVNFGTMNITSASQFKLVYNTSKMNVGTVMFNTSESLVQNDNSMTIGTTDFTNGKLINECLLTVTSNFECESSTIVDLLEGSLLKANAMRCGGTIINIDANAMLNVTGQATFTSNSSDLRGKGTAKNYGLVIFEKEVSEGWDAVKYMGNIEVECSNHSQNTLYNTLYTLNSASGARIVPKGASTVKIEGSDCNSGGNEVKEGEDDDNHDYPQTVTLGTIYSYAFEDTYPNIGDYDMNDFVADVQLAYQLSATNRMSQLTIKTTLRAVGATKHLAVAIQLDGIPAANVSSVSRTGVNMNANVFFLTNGIENGQTNAVIPVVDDAHAAMGMASKYTFINTVPTDTYITPKVITSVVNFNTPVDISKISIQDMINFFVINDGFKNNTRQEIHLRNYVATGKSTDISSGGHYNAKGNLVYGIRVPISFKYPKEYRSIIYAYDYFESWAKSGGSSNPDWYTKPHAGNIYTHP